MLGVAGRQGPERPLKKARVKPIAADEIVGDVAAVPPVVRRSARESGRSGFLLVLIVSEIKRWVFESSS